MTNGTKKLYIKLKNNFNHLSDVFYYLENNKSLEVSSINYVEGYIKSFRYYGGDRSVIEKEFVRKNTDLIKRSEERIRDIDQLTEYLNTLNFNYEIERLDELTIDRIYNFLRLDND